MQFCCHRRDWKSGLHLTKLLCFAWAENGWYCLLSLPVHEFNWGKLLFVPCSPTESTKIPAVFKCRVLWKPWPVGGPGRIAPLEGFQDSLYVSTLPNGREPGRKVVVLRPRSISWLLSTWFRAHNRAEQRWLYLHYIMFGFEGFLGLV